MVSVESPTRFSVWGLSIPHSLVRRKLEPPNESIPRWSGLVFDERSQPFGRVVPLRRDLIEVPLCSLQALAVQVPHPLTPPAGVAHEPHTPEGVEVTRNRLTRHPSRGGAAPASQAAARSDQVTLGADAELLCVLRVQSLPAA